MPSLFQNEENGLDALDDEHGRGLVKQR